MPCWVKFSMGWLPWTDLLRSSIFWFIPARNWKPPRLLVGASSFWSVIALMSWSGSEMLGFIDILSTSYALASGLDEYPVIGNPLEKRSTESACLQKSTNSAYSSNSYWSCSSIMRSYDVRGILLPTMGLLSPSVRISFCSGAIFWIIGCRLKIWPSGRILEIVAVSLF